MEIGDDLKYTFLQFDPAPSRGEASKSILSRSPDYFI